MVPPATAIDAVRIQGVRRVTRLSTPATDTGVSGMPMRSTNSERTALHICGTFDHCDVVSQRVTVQHRIGQRDNDILGAIL